MPLFNMHVYLNRLEAEYIFSASTAGKKLFFHKAGSFADCMCTVL